MLAVNADAPGALTAAVVDGGFEVVLGTVDAPATGGGRGTPLRNNPVHGAPKPPRANDNASLFSVYTHPHIPLHIPPALLVSATRWASQVRRASRRGPVSRMVSRAPLLPGYTLNRHVATYGTSTSTYVRHAAANSVCSASSKALVKP